MRKPIIAGNWKMNKTPAEAAALVNELKPLVADAQCDVVVCVPAVDIAAVKEAAAGSNIKVGAQNVHWAASGAYTGELSADQLVAAGVEYVVIGHSERRQYFGETDVTVKDRVRAALDAGLTVILCVGEYLEQREQDVTAEVVRMQTKIALLGVTEEEMSRIVIAYVPAWAIGTGLTATSDLADAVSDIIRDCIAELYTAEVAEATTIQYGGSMNDANADELLSKVNVDGGLIGGASLVAEKFAAIVKAASK